MPRKDPDEFKEYQREQMRKRRAAAKGITPRVASQIDKTEREPEGQASNETKQPASAKPKASSSSSSTPHQTAAEVADRTAELLETRGWALWKCANLNNDIVVIVRDESVKDFPLGYPVYFDAELKAMADSNMSIERHKFIHEAKKLTTATLIAPRML